MSAFPVTPQLQFSTTAFSMDATRHNAIYPRNTLTAEDTERNENKEIKKNITCPVAVPATNLV